MADAQHFIEKKTNSIAWLCGVDYCNTLLLAEEKIPRDHYFYSFAALANVNAFLSTHEKKYLDAAQAHVDQFLERATSGHNVFNQMAFLLILEKKSLNENASLLLEKIKIALKRFPETLTVNDNVSNNWKVLHACTLALTQDSNKLSKFFPFLKSIQLGDGAFVDYPWPFSEERATPITYHAKMAFWIGWLGDRLNDSNLHEMRVRGARFLSHFITEEGNGLFFGRTPESVFGMVHAYLLFAQVHDETHETIFRACAERMYAKLFSFVQKNGCFSLFTGSPSADASRDFYMHEPVYHAYTTALLSEFTLEHDYSANAPRKPLPTGYFYGEESGLLSWREKGFFFAMSVKGQCAPGQSYFFSDSRYYGMNPLYFCYKGKTLISAPPLNCSSILSPFFPSNNGFGLELRRDGKRGGVRIFSNVNVKKEKNELRITGRGRVGWLPSSHSSWLIFLRRVIGKILHRTPDFWSDSHDFVEADFLFNPTVKKMRISYSIPPQPRVEPVVGARFVNQKDWAGNPFSGVSTAISSSGTFYLSHSSGVAWEGEWK